MGKQLNIGIFGVGKVGRARLTLLQQLTSQFAIAGFFDPSDENAALAQQQFGLSRFTSAQVLIEQCDCIFITCPAKHRFEIASLALRSSKHVLIEPPATTSPEQTKALLFLAQEAGVHVQINHTCRFNPAFLAAKSSIDRPLFIEIQHSSVYSPNALHHSTITDSLLDILDLVFTTVNSRIKRIATTGIPLVQDSVNFIAVRLEFENGCVAHLRSSQIEQNNCFEMKIFKQSGHLTIDLLTQTITAVQLAARHPKNQLFTTDVNQQAHQFSEQSIPVLFSSAESEALKTFHNSIIQHQHLTVSLEDAVHSMNAAHQIMEKLKMVCVTHFDNI